MKKVLVTGGAGFIGSHVVELLDERGYELLVLDNFSTGNPANLGQSVRVVEADLRRPEAAGAVIGSFRPDAVVHLAAQVNVRRSIEDPGSDAHLNVVAGIQVLKACADQSVRRVVFASSGGAIYGAQGAFPVPESAPPRPESPYALSKQALENYGAYFSRSAGMEFIALRLANVYGPRQDARGEAGVVAIFLDALRRGRPPVIYGDGTHTRDYIWVGDVARAFVSALSGPPGTYNIGTGLETRTIEIFQRMKKELDSALDPVFAPGIHGEVCRNALDCALARRELGWSPDVTLTSGLSHLVHSVTLTEPAREEERGSTSRIPVGPAPCLGTSEYFPKNSPITLDRDGRQG